MGEVYPRSSPRSVYPEKKPLLEGGGEAKGQQRGKKGHRKNALVKGPDSRCFRFRSGERSENFGRVVNSGKKAIGTA